MYSGEYCTLSGTIVLSGCLMLDDVVAADGIADRRHRLVDGHAMLRHALEIVPHVDVVAFRDALGDH